MMEQSEYTVSWGGEQVLLRRESHTCRKMGVC